MRPSALLKYNPYFYGMIQMDTSMLTLLIPEPRTTAPYGSGCYMEYTRLTDAMVFPLYCMMLSSFAHTHVTPTLQVLYVPQPFLGLSYKWIPLFSVRVDCFTSVFGFLIFVLFLCTVYQTIQLWFV